MIFIFFLTFQFTFIKSLKNPIIAIYSNPYPDNNQDYNSDYLSMTSVQWLHQAGASTIIIHTWHTLPEINKILNQANGILLIGGDRDLNINNRWEQTAGYILKKVINNY